MGPIQRSNIYLVVLLSMIHVISSLAVESRDRRSRSLQDHAACKDDEYFDNVVNICNPCSDICVHQVDLNFCIINCPEYYRRHSKHHQQHSSVRSALPITEFRSTTTTVVPKLLKVDRLIEKPLFWTSVMSMTVAFLATVAIVVLCLVRHHKERNLRSRRYRCLVFTPLNSDLLSSCLYKRDKNNPDDTNDQQSAEKSTMTQSKLNCTESSHKTSFQQRDDQRKATNYINNLHLGPSTCKRSHQLPSVYQPDTIPSIKPGNPQPPHPSRYEPKKSQNKKYLPAGDIRLPGSDSETLVKTTDDIDCDWSEPSVTSSPPVISFNSTCQIDLTNCQEYGVRSPGFLKLTAKSQQFESTSGYNSMNSMTIPAVHVT